MDLTQTIIAKSDQVNAEDLIGGPQTFTVTDVRMGDSEQPVWIELAELPKGRTFKPSKTVLRILVMAWGKESDEWPEGARMTLYRDADVKWAGQAIGGIRVSHLSHINGKLKVALQESKGKKVLYTVDPLPDAPADVGSVPVDQAGLTRLHAALGKLGIGKGMKADEARTAKLDYCAAVVDHPLESSAKITEAEAVKIHHAIRADIADQAAVLAVERAEAEGQAPEEPTMDGWAQ